VKHRHFSFSWYKKLRIIEICLGLLCTLILLCLNFFQVPVLSALITQEDGRIYDQMIRWNWHPHRNTPKVVIIDIDEASVAKEGRWPWPRDKMARLLEQLKKNGIVTIGMDIVMSEAEINYARGLKDKLQVLLKNPDIKQKQLLNELAQIAPEVDNDQTFVHALLDHTVVLGYLFHHQSHIKTGQLPPPLQYTINVPLNINTLPLFDFEGYNGSLAIFADASKQAGFVTNIADEDGSARHSLILGLYEGRLYASLGLKTAMNYLLVDHAQLVIKNQQLCGIQLDGTYIPSNPYGQILIPFSEKAGTLDYYSATDILQDKVNPDELQGAIAIIGSTMTLLSDLHESPVGLLFPGVEMVGNIVQGIIGQNIMMEYSWSTFTGGLILLLIGLLFALVLPVLSVTAKFFLWLISLLLMIAISAFLFIHELIYVPIVLFMALISIQTFVNYSWSFFEERRLKRKISLLFGQYVPNDYVKTLITSPNQSSMEGQTRNMTALFADIKHFTTISEGLDAASVKRLLNSFFTPITQIIFNHKGTIDKYVGDMIMAFWGAPLDNPEHAKNAVTTALEIFERLPEINANLDAQQLPVVGIGVGLASGLMDVGDMGSEFRRAYTVLGDTVNLASRLQDLTRFYEVDILTNDVTKQENAQFVWRTIDKVAVKGRKTALTIYQPLGTPESITPETLAEIEAYHQALSLFYAKNWKAAKEQFAELIKKYPTLHLYQIYYERIVSFIKSPPPEDWNGVFIHLTK
jgi:adenylate cyclase